MTRRNLTNAAAILLTAAFIFASSSAAFGCRRAGPFSFAEIAGADVIVRATAEKYVREPDLSIMTSGVPDVEVEFKVEEVLEGKDVPKMLILNGYLSDRDDFNDHEIPYKFVRPGGRGGSCFANTYKKGASFLLFLAKTEKGYTPNISALGPTNEQLRGEDDPWLLWVRKEVKSRAKH
jgi:hypothetical protein